MANKNSVYVQSLVDFILDTKPYHAKLTEVVEEYQFIDSMNAQFVERAFISTMAKSAWMYSQFSSGSSTVNTRIHQVLNPSLRVGNYQNNAPLLNRGAFKVNRDENTDLLAVPLAFDPKATQGAGIVDAYVQRAGVDSEPLVEAVDFHQSHGAYVFRVTQTVSPLSTVVGLYSHNFAAGTGAILSLGAIVGGTGYTNGTYAAVPLTGGTGTGATADITVVGGTVTVVTLVSGGTGYMAGDSLSADFGIGPAGFTVAVSTVHVGDGPYPVLVNLAFSADVLVITGPATQVTLTQISVSAPGLVNVTGLSSAPNIDPQYIEKPYESMPGPAQIESGLLHYNNIVVGSAITPTMTVNTITSDIQRDEYEEFTLVADTLSTCKVYGSYSGLLGTAHIPGSFNTPQVSFKMSVATGVFQHTYLVTDVFPITVTLGFTSDQLVITGPAVAISLTQVSVTGPGTVTVAGLSANPAAVAYVPPMTVGDTFTLTPAGQVTLHPSATLETWSLIKTNPLAYTRPAFTSTRYGYIIDQMAVRDRVTLLDGAMVSTSIVLTAVSSTAFTLSSTAEPTYTGTVTVNTPFNDGRLAFTVIQGSAYTFTAGDKFTFDIVNDSPVAEDLDLYYGFDMGPFDSYDSVYNNVNGALADYLKTLDFGYDSRFVNYDTTGFGLVVSQNAVDGRQYRLRALSNGTNLNLGNHVPAGQVNLLNNAGGAITALGAITAGTGYTNGTYIGVSLTGGSGANATANITVSGGGVTAVTLVGAGDGYVAADILSALSSDIGGGTGFKVVVSTATALTTTDPNAAAQYDSTNDVVGGAQQTATDPDIIDDLRLFYATTFEFEYYDTGTNSWVSIDTIAVGASYSNPTHGVAFTLVAATKPFIAAELNSSWNTLTGGPFTETVVGGDVISWTIRNAPATVSSTVSMISPRIPRLIMHASGFHTAPPGRWTLTWTSGTQYSITGVYTSGPSAGFPFYTGTVSLTDGQSYRNETYGLHFTVVNGAAGLQPSDTFTFTVYDRKPTYLVHGSISGWTGDAAVGEWYWNGKIGFKIPVPYVECFYNTNRIAAPWVIAGVGTITLDSIRHDAPPMTYVLTSVNNGRWILYRNGLLVGDGTSVVFDEYIKFLTPTAVAGTSVTFYVRADERQMAFGHDLGIVRTSGGRTPGANDFVFFERAEADTVTISIKPRDTAHSLTLAQLAPVTVDLRFVDHSANSGVPLSATSPETAVLQGWIPALQTLYDSATSLAEFSDTATSIVVRAAATGETIGTIASAGSSITEPVYFTWDSAFATKYLPLNAEATIVTLGSNGMNELVSVNMTDDVKISVSGTLDGAAHAMFHDDVGVAVDDTYSSGLTAGQTAPWSINIKSTHSESMTTGIADGPFVGFLPGYDNTPYDFEDAVDGYYDAGQAFVDYFLQAKALAALVSPTPQQTARLNDLLGLINPYLTTDLASTTTTQFVTALAADPAINYTSVAAFGTPAIGMGMAVDETTSGSASASTLEAMAFTNTNLGVTFDTYGFGAGPVDERADSTTVLFTTLTAPIPNPLPTITTYAALDTPLFVAAPGTRVVEVSFSADIGTVPPVRIWRPTDISPIYTVVEKVDPRVLRITVPVASEMKLIIG